MDRRAVSGPVNGQNAPAGNPSQSERPSASLASGRRCSPARSITLLDSTIFGIEG